MPISYVAMDEEEMTYVEGGWSWSTYKGMEGWSKISTMIASITTWSGSASTLAKVVGRCAATGIGLLLAVVGALGYSLCVACAGIQASMVICAMLFMRADNGFRCKSAGFFTWSIDLVRRL